MPDPYLSDALKEAYASAPSDEVIYHTLEFRHAAFSQPIRVVRDNADLTARLEATAPVDAGAEVTFVGFAFDLVRPEMSAAGVPQCTIEIDNVSREILANVELAMTSIDPIEVTYREYLASDLLGPQNDPPMTLEIVSITADVFRVRATASFTNIGNTRFPGEDYTTDRFPGLVAQ
ncbi:MAG: DUF1833 family protein [Pseudomonadota bacterium]